MPSGRPIKARHIGSKPAVTRFSPRGRRGRPNSRTLAYEELEAIRLVDFMGLDQESSATRMRVSQQTFSRILKKARKAVAAAISLGEILRIEGGCFIIS